MAASEGGPLRVLLSVHHPVGPGGGAAGSTVALADELAARGHDVAVVGFGLLRHPRGGTIDALAFPHAVAAEVRRRLAAGDVDVVDASTGDLAYVGRRRIAAADAAFFTRSHGLEQLAARRRRQGARDGELELRRRYRWYHGGFRLREVSRSMRAADAVLLLNDAEAAFATGTLGLAPSRVWTTTPLARALPAPRPAPPRDVLVLGPCSWRKGGDVARRVLSDLVGADHALSASWVGADDPDAVRETFAVPVRERVEVTGRYDAQTLSDALAAHRVLLFASRSEGLPVTLLEALAAGIACVGADVPGVRELLAGGTGVLVPDGHVDGFVGAVRRLLDDDAARASCAGLGRAAAARRAPSAVVDELVGAYREVLRVKRP